VINETMNEADQKMDKAVGVAREEFAAIRAGRANPSMFAKITAEFAPVSACAAASRTTLDRARASPEMSSMAVTSIIGHFAPGTRPNAIGLVDSRHYEWRY